MLLDNRHRNSTIIDYNLAFELENLPRRTVHAIPRRVRIVTISSKIIILTALHGQPDCGLWGDIASTNQAEELLKMCNWTELDLVEGLPAYSFMHARMWWMKDGCLWENDLDKRWRKKQEKYQLR